MATRISRRAYADMFGPTVGDKVRLADTELFIEVEKDFTTYGDEVKFGGGKVIRDGMGQSQVRREDGAVIGGAAVRALSMPVHWDAPYAAIADALAAIETEGDRPIAVVGLGECGANGNVRVETTARNRRGRRADERGLRPGGGTATESEPGSPATRTSRLAAALERALEGSGCEYVLSHGAGRFLCEEALYVSLGLAPPAGFVHLPAYPNARADNADARNRVHFLAMKRVVEAALAGLA